MGGRDRETTAEELLAHTGWLRGLALRLVGDADVADDLVQETWVAAVRRSPDAGESLRPWLAKVLRDAFRMRARSEGRRSAREKRASMVTNDVPTPEALVAKAEAQRTLVELVLRLEEPYRGVVLLHYCEGVSLADIARSQGIPAGTVRWRVSVGIKQLRAWLDEEPSETRRSAVFLLALPKGVLVAQKSSKLAIGLLLLLVLFGGGIVGVVGVVRSGSSGGGGDDTDDRSQAASAFGGLAWRAGGGQGRLPTWLGQPGLETRTIAGTVTTLDGVPVEGATVELASLATAGGATEPPRRVTNEAGEFDFGPQPPMTYRVHAAASGMTAAAQRVDLRSPISSPPPDQIELRLGPCQAAMIGTVRDASGGPIAGARVAWRQMGPPHARFGKGVLQGAAVETDASGIYELCVDRGRIGATAEVSADGYGAVVLQTRVWGRERFDFSLVPEATVVGRVLREDTGEPVAQAHVSLEPGQWGLERTAARAAFSDGDGRFRITGVAPGPHVIEAFADGLATARETPIVVEAGQTTGEIELVLETRSTVRGVVMNGGEPVAGALVTARTEAPGRTSADAVSQQDGSFVLERVPRGQVRFVARPYEVTAPTTFLVERPEHDGVTIEVEALGAIIGQVVRHDQPVEGARLEIFGPNADEVGAVRSGAEGRFEARGLRPGIWTLFAGSERHGAFGRAEDVKLERGETAEVTIDLAYGAAISGVVVDQDGEPVPGVSAEFRHPGLDDIGVATTNTDGSFRATMMLGGGDYRPTVRRRARSSAVLRPASGGAFPPVTLADGASQVTGVVLAVRLDRLSIAGRVVDEAGAPVPDARVSAKRTEAGIEPRFGRWFHHTSTISDVDGHFSLGDLSAGTYALQARASSGAEAVARGVVAGRKDVSIVLPSPGTIEGSLVGFGEAPRVFALRQDSRATPELIHGVVSGTRFLLRPLSPGTYTVSAQTGTEAASGRVEVRAGARSQLTLTSTGSASVAGRVRDFRSGEPVEGMTCVPWPRVGTDKAGRGVGDGDRTDSEGAFELTAVPAGEIAIACHFRGRSYTKGLRLVTVAPSQRLEIDVPVVKIRQDVAMTLAGIGADLDRSTFVARLDRVEPGGPAAEAGLKDGDVIIAVDGDSVTELSPMGVWFLVANRPPGTAVKVTVRRGGDTLTTTLRLGPPDGP